ncbi:hypothetical protein [Bacillus pumilus]|uniref:hypothetical protein n=1 Tax=Bacillus pumilus TaxID=1408 RepID=UPI0015D564AF|nr:hypothetical protein [Bacillus pumilus]QLI79582.1 hypothetical protein HZ310_17975 [Bacillus pumilus]
MIKAKMHMVLNNGVRYSQHNLKKSKLKYRHTIAKKLAVQALCMSGTYLEKPLSKVIDKKCAKKAKSGFYKGCAIFIQAGLPPDVAFETAKFLWIIKESSLLGC